MMEVAGFFLASKRPCPTAVLIACIYINIYFTTMEYKVGLQSPNYLSENHQRNIERGFFGRIGSPSSSMISELQKIGTLLTQAYTFPAGIVLGELAFMCFWGDPIWLAREPSSKICLFNSLWPSSIKISSQRGLIVNCSDNDSDSRRNRNDHKIVKN